jgi:hypothetical protein
MHVLSIRAFVIFCILEFVLLGMLRMAGELPAWVWFAASGLLLSAMWLFDHRHRIKHVGQAEISLIGLAGVWLVTTVLLAVGTWGYFRSAPAISPNPKIAQPLVAGSPATSQPIVWEHYKTTEHKARISEALHRLSEILNKPVSKIESDSQGLIQYWESVKLNPDRRPELQNILKTLDEMRLTGAAADDQFRALLNDYQAYGDLWRIILDLPTVERERPLPRWHYARNDFYDALTTYDAVYGTVDGRTREGLAKIVNPTLNIFRDATANLNDWIVQSNKRAEAEKKKIFQ